MKDQRKREKIYIFIVDFKSTFDTVDREALYYKLYKYGISSKFMNVIKGLYTEIQSQREGVSESFESSRIKTGILNVAIMLLPLPE